MIRLDLTAEQADTILGRLRTGTISLITESKALGFTHNGPLRDALRRHLGEEQYAALRLKRGRKPTRPRRSFPTKEQR